jgi:large subunit ribosomal protein L16
MQQPPKRKFRKDRKGVLRGSRMQKVEYGSFGIQSINWGRINPRHIETVRRIIVRGIRGHKTSEQKVWIRVFADKPVSKKPLEVRQGKGKGSVDHWVFRVRPGVVMFEFSKVSEADALDICRLINSKLPVAVRLIAKNEFEDE